MAAVKKLNQFVNMFLAFWLIFSIAGSILPRPSRAEPKDILSLLKEKGILSDEDLLTIRESEKDRLKGKFKNGFQWETGDGLAAIQIGGRVNADIDIFEDGHVKNDSIYLKRARIFTSGRVLGHYEWKVEGEFGEGAVAARDLFININYDERMQVKIGQYKEPFAMEQNTSVNYIDFKERSIIGSRIAPDRDIGLMLHGLLSNDTIGYQLGVFNGNGQNNSSDSDNDKDAAMRIWYEPFKDLHIGGAFAWGHKSRGLVDYKTPVSGSAILAFDSSKVSGKNMNLLRSGAELSYGIGPCRVVSEYMRADYNDVDVLSIGGRDDFFVQGVYATASWFLTGEEKRPQKGAWRRIKPNQEFNPKTGGKGAWELLAGYEWVDVDKDWFKKGGLSGAPETNSYKAGVNWYLNPMFRVMLDYVYNDYSNAVVSHDSGAKDDKEHMVWMRFALEY